MIFQHATPILYSDNVSRSLTYYVDILGFDHHWEWGNPPSFGGVVKDGVEIFFCEKGQGNPGTWLSVLVDNVDAYYEMIKTSAKILMVPETREWGIREMLVEDPDGHRIRFGQKVLVSGREKSADIMSQTIRIIARIPTTEEIQHLATSVGWSLVDDKDRGDHPSSTIVFAVVAEEIGKGEVIGCAFLLGDHAGFYYVKDVMVHPEWQGQRVGTALMQEVARWLEKNATDKSSVWLHTSENLAPFYKQFGFIPTFGMRRLIQRDETDQ